MFGVEVLAVGIFGGDIGRGLADDFRNADDAGFSAVRVVEEDAIAQLHLVAHHVARLIVAHAVPRGGLRGQRGEGFDPEDVGLGFH